MEGSYTDPPISVVTDDDGDIIVCFGPRCVKVTCGGPGHTVPPPGPPTPGATDPDVVTYEPDTGQAPMRLMYGGRHAPEELYSYIRERPKLDPVFVTVPSHTTVNLADLDGLVGAAQDAGRPIELHVLPDG